MNGYVLMTYYIKYLKEIRKLSDSSIKHYQEALRYISKYLSERKLLEESIYEIKDLGQLEVIKTYLYKDDDFIALDKRGHQMYSAGLNNYYRFASGLGFSNIHEQIEIMDQAVPVGDKKIVTSESWSRSSIIKVQAIESAGYQCEINPAHITFTAKSTNHPYMEGHHALPMKFQDEFTNSLDVYANVVCLCPVCHRLLHYGIEREKKNVVDKLYYDRADRLATSGIRIGKADFEKYVG